MKEAVIFAGGKSSRMGEDKAFLPFGGTTLVRYQYDRLSSWFEHVFISTKKDKFDFEAEFIFDRGEVFSPAVALHSVLTHLQSEAVFVLSVDVPFLSKAHIDTLYNRLGDHEAAAAKTAGGTQPMCAVYTKKLLPALEKQLEKENHKLNFLLRNSDTVFVEFDDEEAFLNLNYKSDYEKALALAEAQRFE